MGRIKTADAEKINIIKEITKKRGASPRLISVWLNVKYTTVSSWNSNTSQPNEENLNEIGELLEIDNRLLKVPQGRLNTGLASYLETELKRLTKDQKIPWEIYQQAEKTGKSIKMNNPALRNKLLELANEHRKDNSKIIPPFIDKLYSDIGNEKLKGRHIFICKAESPSEVSVFEFLVVNETLGENKFVARFARKEDAEKYVEWMECNAEWCLDG